MHLDNCPAACMTNNGKIFGLRYNYTFDPLMRNPYKRYYILIDNDFTQYYFIMGGDIKILWRRKNINDYERI